MEEFTSRKGKEEMTQEEENSIEGIIGESLGIQEIFQRTLDRFQGQGGIQRKIEEEVIEEEVVPEMRIEGVSQEKITKESIRAA